MKKVLVFSPYYPPHVGGLESHADEFNKYLAKHGYEITVFTPRLPTYAIEKEVRYKNVKVIRYPAWEIIDNYPLPCFWNRRYWILWNKVKKDKYEWVISRTRFFLQSFMAGIFAKRNRVRWLHIEHGSDYVKLNSWFKNVVSKVIDHSLGRWILKGADKVVANSKATAKFCKKIYSGKKYEVIYRGVELMNFSENKVLKNKYSGKVVVSYVGRLIDGKGVSDLIEAVSKLESNDWILWIIGEGPRRTDLKRLVKKKGLKKRIVFFGQVEKKKLLGMLSVSDIFVNPSYTEGLPTSVIEAAWCKNAIVATDVGGTREILSDKGGLLFEPKDIDALEKYLTELISNRSLREEFARNAYSEVRGKFDWKISIAKYERLLRS